MITVSPRINFKVVHYEYINVPRLHLRMIIMVIHSIQKLYKYLRDNIDTESRCYLWHIVEWNETRDDYAIDILKLETLLRNYDYLGTISKIDLIEDFLNTIRQA